MKSDSLEDALKKRLQDYTPAQSVPSWQQMQRRMQLHANAHPELEIRPKRNLGRRLGYGTAAALLLIAAGIGVYRSGLPSLQDIPEQTYTASGGDKAQLPAPAKGERSGAGQTTAIGRQNRGYHPAGRRKRDDRTGREYRFAFGSLRYAEDGRSRTRERNNRVRPASIAAERNGGQNGRSKRLADHSRLFDTPDPQKRRPRHGWIASAFANASTFSSAASGSGPTPTRLTSLLDGNSSFAYTKGGVPEFGRGNMDHKFPVSVGLNVRKYLAPRLVSKRGWYTPT